MEKELICLFFECSMVYYPLLLSKDKINLLRPNIPYFFHENIFLFDYFPYLFHQQCILYLLQF